MATTSIINLIALVTGASRGIGNALARRLATEGVRIIISGRSHERLEQTVSYIEKAGGTVKAIPCDFSEESEVRRLAEETIGAFGGLDILINNAGTSVNRPFEETTVQEWNHLMAVNANAPFVLCQACLPALKQSSQATIINIGSVVGIKGYINQAAYTASKHALMGFTKVLSQEVQPHGIRVHAINPGGVATDMIREMRPDLDTSGLIQPDDIADLIVFLLTHRTNASIDDIHIRRANGEPWY